MNNLFCQCTAVPVIGKLKPINGIIIEHFAASHVLSFLIMLISLSIYLPPSISFGFLHCYNITHATYVQLYLPSLHFIVLQKRKRKEFTL